MEAIGSQADPRLKGETHEVAKRIRATRLFERQAKRWIAAAAIACGILALGYFVPFISQYYVVALLAVIAGTLFLGRRDSNREPLDYIAAAKAIESENQSLDQALSTAMEQSPKQGPFNFLQRKLVDEILDHQSINEWQDTGRDKHRKSIFRNVLASIPAWIILVAAFFLEPSPSERLIFSNSQIALTVSPGDVEAERGSTVVVTARFDGDSLPKNVSIATLYPDGREESENMGQSLSDPVFVFSLRKVESDLRYRIEYDGQESDAYDIEIFDLPALTQSDATLNFPEYTRIPSRFIEDTRRISAVQGTEAVFSFTTNKPIDEARLVNRDGSETILEAANPERTRFDTAFVVDKSLRATLHLKDDKGRVNPFPPDIRLEALPNKRPELSIAFPRGDQRVSPIEEIALEAEARDDFGLIDYGLGYSIGAQPPVYLSSGTDGVLDLDSEFDTLIALENESVAVDDLLSWFAWADDFGPDGEPRRSTSDLYFAEVRSLEEIFREAEGGGGQQGQQQGQGNQGEELIETQRQIAIALWKMKQRDSSDESFFEDVEVINESQVEALQQLTELKERLEEEKTRFAANLAEELMKKVSLLLDTSIDDRYTDPLDTAAANAQGATQALLRMQPKEFNVSQSRQAGGGGGGQSRNQRQLDQLDFQREENRYETASQAQTLTSPEQKEQLQVLSKLSELARRQDDINQRLQELQTAIANAKDEEERERIRRELKRLEEEQRQMLADVDEARQRMDRLQSNEENREARQQLDQAREQMRELGESLANEEISQALATGTRAQENLEELKENFRNETSSQFTEQLREARQTARDLAENQRAIGDALEDLDRNEGPRLDNSEERERITDQMRQQQEELDTLMQGLREVTEASEFSEQKLHRDLYDLLREQSQSEVDEQLQTSSDMLRQGFVEQTQGLQPELQRSFDELQRNVEQAAESLLGDEATSLRYAQEELDSLTRDLQAQQDQEGRGGQRPSESPQEGGRNPESQSQQPGQQSGQSVAQSPTPGHGESPGQQPGGQQPGGQQPGGQQGGSQAGGQQGSENQQASNQQNSGSPFGGGGGFGGEDLATTLDNFIRDFSQGSPNESPLTGRGFGDWNERLRTVEELVDQPDIRQRLSQAREEAERIRADFKRHGAEPQWGIVDDGIIAPLTEARAWVAQELARHEDPEALQPIDRDPVPRAYQESVQNYYESLGERSTRIE